MNQEELLENFRAKNVKAFEKIHQMYHENVLGIVYNILRNEELAEEVTQDVFVKAWNNADRFDPNKGRFFTWILNIARNTAIDKTRSKNFNTSHQNLDAQNFVDIIVSNDNLNAKTDAIGLKAFVNKLADTCKRLIELIYFKGYTQKETAESLNMPLGTVKTKSRGCLNELRILVE